MTTTPKPSLLRRLLADEHGGEILEYVMIAGLIIIACVVAVAGLGAKVLARWNGVNSGMP